jgi:hypothetical protein
MSSLPCRSWQRASDAQRPVKDLSGDNCVVRSAAILFFIAQECGGRYLPWRPKVPSPTWRSFLHNHLTDIAAIDMFVVATATFRLLYARIVLGHDRRKIPISRSPKIRHKSGHRAK